MTQDSVVPADPTPEEIARDLRQLALVDRVLGLEAENARLSSTLRDANGSREEIARLEGELRAAYASRTWLVGSAILKPLVMLRGGKRT